MLLAKLPFDIVRMRRTTHIAIRARDLVWFTELQTVIGCVEVAL